MRRRWQLWSVQAMKPALVAAGGGRSVGTDRQPHLPNGKLQNSPGRGDIEAQNPNVASVADTGAAPGN
jgi:hypothetical protein